AQTKSDANPYRGVTYQKIRESLKSVSPVRLPDIAKQRYTENVIKCTDFDIVFEGINQRLVSLQLLTPPSLESIVAATKIIVEARYSAATEFLDEPNNENICAMLQSATLFQYYSENLQEA